MILEEKEVVATTENEEEEVVEIEDLDAGLKPEDVKLVKEETKKKIVENHVLSKEQQKIFKDMLKAADMPTKIGDGEFKLGKNELDIRYLSKDNKIQMLFRSLVLQNTYSKQILTSLIDLTRLLMILCDKLGVEDIVSATDDIIDKIDKQTKFKKQLKAAKADKVAVKK